MLNNKQQKCLKLMLETKLTQKEMADELKVSEQTICNWKKNENFKKEFDDAMKEAISFSAASAYKEMLNLLKAKSELVRYQAAKDLLDRAGYKPTDKVEAGIEGTFGVTIIDDIGTLEDA